MGREIPEIQTLTQENFLRSGESNSDATSWAQAIQFEEDGLEAAALSRSRQQLNDESMKTDPQRGNPQRVVNTFG